MSDKALEEANYARKIASSAAEQAADARQQARNEEENCRNAQIHAQRAEAEIKGTKMTYKSLFVGTSIFTVVIAFFVAYSKGSVLKEMLQWFPDRLDNIKSFIFWTKDVFMGAIKLMNNAWSLSVGWCYVIAILGLLGILVGLFFLGRWLFYKIVKLKKAINSQYTDKIFKGVISADIVLTLLYVCLFFYEPVKNFFPLNIFSIWLLFSVVGCTAWNFPEIKEGLQYYDNF